MPKAVKLSLVKILLCLSVIFSTTIACLIKIWPVNPSHLNLTCCTLSLTTRHCSLHMLVLIAVVAVTHLAVFANASLSNIELPSTVLRKYIDINVHDHKRKRLWKEIDMRKYYVKSRGSDGEFIDAANHFFWNKTDGIAMELGAVDGMRLSETRNFVPFGWNRILVEANPINLERLETNPHSIIIHSAICDKRQTVHFYHQNHQSGIVEFSQLSDDKRAAMLKLSVEVECLPLAHVFQAIKVSHVNYFVLDVEGAELNILQSIDWDLTKFDVIVVETDRNSRRPGFAEDVAAFMLTKGYLRVDNISGRNSWYRRVDFVPSRRPTIAEGCYSGALWATRWRFRNATQQDNFKKCPAGFFSDSNKHCQNCGMIQPPS